MSNPLRHFASAYAMFALVGVGAAFGWLCGSAVNYSTEIYSTEIIPTNTCAIGGAGFGLLTWFGILALYADSKRSRIRFKPDQQARPRPRSEVRPYDQRLSGFVSRNMTHHPSDSEKRMPFWQRETFSQKTNPRSGASLKQLLIHIAKLVERSFWRRSNRR